MTKDGTCFDVQQNKGLHYLYYVDLVSDDCVAGVRVLDLCDWHKIMGHCNVEV